MKARAVTFPPADCGDLPCSTQKNANDVVITLAIRTPLTKAFRGGMKDTPLDFIVYSLLKKVIERSNIDPKWWRIFVSAT
jgi:hypothetical protein